MAARISLQRVLLATVVVAILVGVVPAGIALDRRLSAELMTQARSDLEMAASMIPSQPIRNFDALGRLTRSDVTLLVGPESRIALTTLDTTLAAEVRRVLGTSVLRARAREIDVRGRMLLAVSGPLGADSTVVFTRDRAAELAVISQLHRMAAISIAVALLVALVLGT